MKKKKISWLSTSPKVFAWSYASESWIIDSPPRSKELRRKKQPLGLSNLLLKLL